MFCKRAVYVNWGNIPHLEFDFGPINLFSGGNGSGKTTAADGLQSLMTAAHENLFTYNPGQDETTQKGRGGKQVRTLASYVLGCDDGSYARTRMTDGYIAGVFHPTQGETGNVFTAIMCVRARLDTASSPRQSRQDTILFLIIPNQELYLRHFVREDNSGKYVVPITQIVKLLAAEFGKDCVEVYEKKGSYLRRLYGAFRGLAGAVSDREAKHAARTFSNFMAYKPVKSISEFVAREVLEPKDLSDDIRQVSELMKTIHSMNEETQYIKQAIDNLETAQHLADNYINTWAEHCVGKYCSATCLLLSKQNEYLSQKKSHRNNQQFIVDIDTKLKEVADKKQLLHTQLIELEAQRQGINALKNKDQLNIEIEDHKDLLVKQLSPLVEQHQQFSKNCQAAIQLQQQLSLLSLGVDIPTLDSKACRQQLKKVANSSDNELDISQLLAKNWEDISVLEPKFDQMLQLEQSHSELSRLLHSADSEIDSISIRDKLLFLNNKHKDQLQKIQQQLINKEQEIKHLKHHKVNYPTHVELAIAAIKQQCPQAKPSVLCDFIEVTDPAWQMAIEGYMGGARFSIIVEPEYEAQAIRIIRVLKGAKNKARIIQAEKAQRDAATISVAKNSMFNVMCFEHKVAEYYLKASYGTVLRVDSEEILKKTARGIIVGGLGSGSYSMFRCDLTDANLVFGQHARERALAAKQSQWQLLQQQKLELEEQLQATNHVSQLINDIKSIHCSAIVHEILAQYRRLHMAESQLQNLDLSDFEESEIQLKQLKEAFIALEQEGKQLSEKRGGYVNKVKQCERMINTLTNEQDELESLQEEKESLVCLAATIYPSFDAKKALQRADQQANATKSETYVFSENRDYIASMDRLERRLYESIMQHNQLGTGFNHIVYFTAVSEKNDVAYFKQVVALAQDISNVYHSLKNNVLVGKHEKLAVLKDSFNTAFVTNLCHSIYQSINDGKSILEQLNQELEQHVFGTDKERFSFGWDWVPEYQEYWRFFKEVIDIPNLGDNNTLFDIELSEKACSVRDKLLAMLLDKDTQYALRELQRISDYRHYRSYEIYKEPLNKQRIALSKYGTGSGGQLETPAYIIRAAAVTSAFRYNEGSSHCRMVLVDEAFSKMDETRSREVIHYLTQSLGLQLIFIMPTSKSGPFMDLISNQVVFSKCPTAEKIGELNTRVLVDRKICNQQKIHELWAHHRKTIRQQAMLDFMDEIV